MNILQLLQKWSDKVKPASPEYMEWKPGQIVRGKVLQLLEDQHAIVKINGTNVRVKLEIPLQLGHTTLLQVQPISKEGWIQLKPLQQSKLPIPIDSVKEILTAAGLSDDKKNRELVLRMYEAGWIPDRETIQSFRPILDAIPEDNSVRLADWIRSGIMAKERNLSMTRAFIEPLYLLQYGTPMRTLVENLLRQLQSLQDRQLPMLNNTPSISSHVPATLQTDGFVNSDASTNKSDAVSLPINRNQVAVSDTEISRTGKTDFVHAQSETRQQSSTPSQTNVNGDMTKNSYMQGQQLVDENSQLDRNAAQTDSNLFFTERARPEAANSKQVDLKLLISMLEGFLQQQGSSFVATPSSEQNNWLLRMFQALGLNFEHQLSQVSDSHAFPSGTSLKPLLMQLIATEGLPQGVRDQANQLLQQLTGQQLLLGAEKVTPTYHAVTVVVPFYHSDGQQTATVQIQSRKQSNKKHAIDPDHCRLWFDLTLKHLGPILIDVQVVERGVSLTIRNNDTRFEALLEQMKERLKQNFTQTGYRLVSIQMGAHTPTSSVTAQKDASTPISHDVAPVEAYEGVDIRI